MFFTNYYFTLLIPPIKCLVVLVGELDAINLTMTTQILLLHWKLFKSTQFSVTMISALSAWLMVGTDIKLVITLHEYRAMVMKWKRMNKTEATTEIEWFDWFIEQIQTHVASGWLSEYPYEKNFMPENFLEINRYFALTSYFNMIGQSNNAFSILGFSLAGKWSVHVLIFSSIGWYNK